MSIVISASSASAPSLITGAVAAVVLVFSVASIVIFVDNIEVPHSFMSNVKTLQVGAVVTLALTSVTVNAYGILNVFFAVPVVNAVVSSPIATEKHSFLFIKETMAAHKSYSFAPNEAALSHTTTKSPATSVALFDRSCIAVIAIVYF